MKKNLDERAKTIEAELEDKPENEYTPTGDEPENEPEKAKEGLASLNKITNGRDYVESLQRMMKEPPPKDPTPAQKQQQSLLAVSIFAARAAIDAKAGSFRGGALDRGRDFQKEAALMKQIGKSDTFMDYIKNTPYEKLRSLILTGHGGEMEKSFRGFVAKRDKLSEDVPERLMPTAKERCEELQKQLRSAQSVEAREDICRELIATRMAVDAKRGGAGLEKTPNAERVDEMIERYKDDPAMKKVLGLAAENPKARELALNGHGGAFMDKVMKTAEKQRAAAAPEMKKG